MAESIGTVSGNFPSIHFAIIDAIGTDSKGNDLKHANVVGLLFKEQEAGALVGTIAASWRGQRRARREEHDRSIGGIKDPAG